MAKRSVFMDCPTKVQELFVWVIPVIIVILVILFRVIVIQLIMVSS